jgi:hypothetical protein
MLRVREALGEAAFARFWVEGEAMSLDPAIGCALAHRRRYGSNGNPVGTE